MKKKVLRIWHEKETSKLKFFQSTTSETVAEIVSYFKMKTFKGNKQGYIR